MMEKGRELTMVERCSGRNLRASGSAARANEEEDKGRDWVRRELMKEQKKVSEDPFRHTSNPIAGGNHWSLYISVDDVEIQL